MQNAGLTPEHIAAIERYARDPVSFFIEVLGCDTLEDYQIDALNKIAENPRIAISACHDVGKSWLMARVVIWFLVCFPYSKVITTAPTFNQVKNILWSEIRAAYARSKFPLGGKMNQTEWQITEEGDWFAIGFTPRNELSGEAGQGKGSTFQGFHAPYILVVFDEATGIPDAIWTMVEGILTSANVKFCAIGNPTSRMAQFFKCFSSKLWTKIKLSCFNSPNLRANGITNIDELQKECDAVSALPEQEAIARTKSYKVTRPYLLTLQWVVEYVLVHGIEHPLVQSKALGEFPVDADDVLMPLGIIEDAQLRAPWPTNSGERRVLGVDVARFGIDETVLTDIEDKTVLTPEKMIKKTGPQIVGRIINKAQEVHYDVICVDETGVGSAVVDGLNEAKTLGTIEHCLRNTEIRGVQFGAALQCNSKTCKHDSDCDKAKFVNLKARMFRLLADDLRNANGLRLCDERSGGNVYLDELPTILYSYDSKGRMFVESKDDYKKRTGRKSPDHADSLALANFGRYDEMSVGIFPDSDNSGYAKPFAAGLGGRKQW